MNTAQNTNYDNAVLSGVTIDTALEHRVALYRLNRLKEQITAHNLNAVILFEPINIRYACGARNMQVYSQRNPARYIVVPADGPVVLFEYRSCLHLAEGLPTLDEVRYASPIMPLHSGDHSSRHVQDFIGQVAEILSRSASNGKHIGINGAPPEVHTALAAEGYVLSDATRPIEIAKSIKSIDELVLINRSVELTEEAMRYMESVIEPGITENWLWSVFQQKVLATGGEYLETRLLTSGENTNPWFQETSERVMQPGELVAFDTDTGGVYGYYTDFSRTFFNGRGKQPTDEQKTLYQLAYDEIHINIALLEPVMDFRGYAEKAWKIPKGYQENRYLAVVHGCGMTGEWPIIAHHMDWESVGYNGIIEPGMTLCVESYIGHKNGKEGVKLEEQVLIGETKVHRMSCFPYSDVLRGKIPA